MTLSGHLSPGKKLFFTLLAGGLVLVIVFFTMEIACRFFYAQGRIFFFPHLNVPPIFRPSRNPDTPYELQPGFRGFAYGVPVRINALGFRGEDPDPIKNDRTSRIVILGDSTAFGFGVEEDDCLVNRLQVLLDASGTEVEVLNAGIPGYGLRGEIAVLEEKVRALQPDIVVVVFDANDLPVGSYGIRSDYGINYLTAGPERKAPLRLILKALLLDQSYFLSALRFRWHSFRQPAPIGRRNESPQHPLNVLLVEKMRQLRSLAREHGFQLLVCPSVQRFHEPFAGGFAQAAAEGLAVITLLKNDEFKSLGWNPHGDRSTHELMAARLQEALEPFIELDP